LLLPIFGTQAHLRLAQDAFVANLGRPDHRPCKPISLQSGLLAAESLTVAGKLSFKSVQEPADVFGLKNWSIFSVAQADPTRLPMQFVSRYPHTAPKHRGSPWSITFLSFHIRRRDGKILSIRPPPSIRG
jgi:hypothetical protein